MSDLPGRRLYAPVVLGLLATGAIALLAVSRAWATATVRTPGLPVDEVSRSGVYFAPVLIALGLVVVAGALAVVAAGGWLRQVIGLVIAAASMFATLRTFGADSAMAVLQNQPLLDSPSYVDTGDVGWSFSTWPLVAAAAFFTSAVLGTTVSILGRRWPRMSARYERETPADVSIDDPWRALDDGHDPTL